MTTRQNLAVVVGTYQQEGQDKNRYMNIGTIITKDDGGKFMEISPFINYTALPRKDGKLYISVFDEKDTSNKPKEAKPSVNDEEAPF